MLQRVLAITGFAAIHAVCFALMFPPHFAWPLAFVTVAPLVVTALLATRTWQVLLGVGVVEIALFLWLQRWTAGISQAGYVPLAVYCALWPTLFVIVLRRALRHEFVARLPLAITAAILWTGFEFFRGTILLNGYPWFLLGHPLVEWPVQAQSADLLGTYFLGSVAAAFSGLLVDIWRCRRNEFSTRKLIGEAVVVAALLIVNLGYGSWRMSQTDALRPGPTLLAVQTNLPQDNRNAWTAEMQAEDVPGFMELTRAALAEAETDIDLIVWPETLVPGVGFEQEAIDLLSGFGAQAMHMYRWPIEVDQFARELGIAMLVGAPAWVGPQTKTVDGMIELLPPEHRYNSAYLITGDLPYQRYDKYFLTPFGETMPYISSWPWLEQKLLSLGASGMTFNLSAADEIDSLEFSFDGKTIGLGTPICFEDCVSHVIRQMVYPDGSKRVDLLVNLSNDGWFWWDDGTRQQRVQISRLRCIENRVPLVRSVNTGNSVHLDSMGKVAAVISEGRYGTSRIAGALVAQTQLDSRRTIYGRIGDVWGWICLAGLVCLTIIALKRPNVR